MSDNRAAMSQTQQVNSAESPEKPLTLAYRDAPTGEVVASDAALLAMKETRPWAMVCAIFLFLYALAAGGRGTMWLVVIILKRAQPGFPLGQFIVISTANLLFAPIALLGGVLERCYITAAGRAYNSRSSEDLQRAMIAQARWPHAVSSK